MSHSDISFSERSIIDNTILVEAAFLECNIDDASFREADIRMAHFFGSTLRRTIWTGNVEGDNTFTDVDFTGCQ